MVPGIAWLQPNTKHLLLVGRQSKRSGSHTRAKKHITQRYCQVAGELAAAVLSPWWDESKRPISGPIFMGFPGPAGQNKDRMANSWPRTEASDSQCMH